MPMICKDCYIKKYGKFSDLLPYESEEEGICFVCGEKKQMLCEMWGDYGCVSIEIC